MPTTRPPWDNLTCKASRSVLSPPGRRYGTTQRSKKGSEKVLAGVLGGKGAAKVSEKGACHGFYSKKGF